MNFRAWMLFVPSAFSLLGNGFLFHWGIMDYFEQRDTDADGSGAAVDGVGGLQRQRRPLLRQLRLVAGGDQHQHLRRHQLACVDLPRRYLLQEVVCHRSRVGHDHWPRLHHSRCKYIKMVFFRCIRLAIYTSVLTITNVVDTCWATIVMGKCSGSIPWFTMMVVHKRSRLLKKVDDTLGVFHAHAVAGFLGGLTTSLFVEPVLCGIFLPVTNSRGSFYGGNDGM
ncbi:ammonium transporter 3 member 1 [Canna indica]|uniref:Ammonium transporter 3 member 1 n=1 Tax=Canna indica TaxID=4628 RepID=A0AAQ3KFH5_9LILI|nr:ammonium transporter 3 member 1 [Canna indica]